MRRPSTAFTVALACASALYGQTTQPVASTQEADVPIKTIKLFSSGVGYFERAGMVNGEDHTTLKFKTEQINDILKSLVLQDQDGGSPGVITYPSQDPIAKTLAGFSVNLSNNSSLLDLLTQLRGSQLTVTSGPEQITGTLLSTETKQHIIGDGKTIVPYGVLNVLSGTEIRAIPLDEVRDVKLDDPQLQSDLTRALSTLASARDQNQKSVEIAFHGNGQRHVRIGYVVESPVWKTSYRLVLAGDQKGDQPHLQGWAMVDNPTDSDWNDVQLSLISGRPISFVENLYSPIYLARPVVQPNMYAGLQPPGADQGGIGGEGQSVATELGTDRYVGGRLQMAKAMNREMSANAMATPTAAPAAPPMDALSSVITMASTAKLGELFSYSIPNVTLRRHESAMLPIVTEAVEAPRVSVYNHDVQAVHPLNGVRLKNTTDKHLLEGPITVFDKGSYAGDAQVDNLPPGQSRLLSFGIDLKMSVNSDHEDNEQSVVSGTISKGTLLITQRNISTHEFKIDNRSNDLKTLVIEDPVRGGWKFIDTPKPVETTETVNRFQIDAPAQQSITFTVKQGIDTSQQLEILPMDGPALTVYATTGTISKSVRDALAKAVDLKAAVVSTQHQIDETNAKIKSIDDEQKRIRANMQAVDKQSDYYNRLMKKLNDQESQIEKLQGQLTDLRQTLDKQTAALNDYVADLNVE
ncbi:MAG: DUF4139 domain-containing protein [Phycisphaerae bacterium]|nr:DUF4139 domain-containing protein [Phycisphaerae bacterium]